MARMVADRRELTATLVVYGAAKSGKTSILHCVQDRVAPDRRSNLSPFGSDRAMAPLLDWLPLELGVIGGWHVRVHLYAIPDQRHADATRRLVLADADGVLLAADAQASRLADNQSALRSLRDNLHDHDGRVRDVPMVLAYTKSDLPAELLLPRELLNRELNPTAVPDFACSALRGDGVLEALHALVTLTMRSIKSMQPARG